MTNFQWFQAAGITIALLSFAIALPTTTRIWRREHRISDRIDRNTKAIAQAYSTSAIRVLKADSNKYAVRLAAIRAFRIPPPTEAVAALGQVLVLLALVELVVLPILGFGWSAIIYALITYAVALILNALVTPRIYRILANRMAYQLSGGPANFRPATRLAVPYRDYRLPIFFAYFLRAMKLRKTFGSTTSVAKGRLYFYKTWERLIDAQNRYYTVIKDRPARKDKEIRRRAKQLKKTRKRQRRRIGSSSTAVGTVEPSPQQV